MKTDRRRFLSLLGVGAASAPLAAKAAADELIAKQMGINLLGGPGMPGGAPSALGAGSQTAQGNYVSHENKVHMISDYIKMFGVPDFFEKDLKSNSQWVSALDPDLAAKRSWSMSVKLQEQRQRNYHRQLDYYMQQSWQLRKKTAIQKILGFEWPWG